MSKITGAAFAVTAFIGGYLFGGWVYASRGEGFIEALSQWQTLLTGPLALVGAGWTVAMIGKQIEQARDAATDNAKIAEGSRRATIAAQNASVIRRLNDYDNQGRYWLETIMGTPATQQAVPQPIVDRLESLFHDGGLLSAQTTVGVDLGQVEALAETRTAVMASVFALQEAFAKNLPTEEVDARRTEAIGAVNDFILTIGMLGRAFGQGHAIFEVGPMSAEALIERFAA